MAALFSDGTHHRPLKSECITTRQKLKSQFRHKTASLLVLVLISVPTGVWGQSNLVASSNLSVSNSSPAKISPAASRNIVTIQRVEATRLECIQGRRSICGKILKVLPDGLVVDSGYTDLLRPPLTRGWLVPGSVTTRRTANLVEGNEPDSVAVGVVYLTDLPKSRGKKPKPYDYVIIEGYPAGQYTYPSVGSVEHTVRRFCTTLPKAVQFNLQALADKNQPRS
jgi:hypothetical protein